MARLPRQKSISGYYHVIVRGIGRQVIFEESNDYKCFINLLSRYKEEFPIKICAYCLMSNHVHMLLYDPESTMPDFMKKLGVSYASIFNNKYERTGHLFQDRYKSEPINTQNYLLRVFRYILRNPEAAGICLAEDYPWSSYKEYGAINGLTDTSIIAALLGEDISSFMSISDNNTYMEYNTSSKLTDEDALQVLRGTLSIKSGLEIQSYEREARNNAIRKLKIAGLSIRQIERLTGINRGTVYNITKN